MESLSLERIFGRSLPRRKAEGADLNYSDNAMHSEYIYNQGTPKQRKIKALMRWILLFVSGVSISLMYCFMSFSVEAIQEFRMDRLANNFEENGYFAAWINHFGLMAGLLAPAVLLVLIEPASGGGGIPEIIAYLNGIKSHRSFAGFTVLAKIFGTILAVASGIAIGPEGPTIHLGAALTLNIMDGLRWAFASSSSFGLPTGLAGAFNNDHDRRLFMAGGAAAGIACAFRAPIGGVLFALEEAVSHFDSQLIVRIYFMCVISYYTLMIVIEGDRLNSDRFTEYQLTVGCNAGYDAEDIVLFALLGIIGGLTGGCFNILNMKINYWRKAHVNTHGWKRALEMLVIAFITSLLVVFVPMALPCTSSDSLVTHLPNIRSINGLANISTRADPGIPPDFCLSTDLQAFCMDNDEIDPGELQQVYKDKYLRNALCDDKSQYNQLESLLQGSGHRTVALLFEEGAYEVFDYGPLLLFLFIYSILAMIAAGSSVPAGLVIPMLTIGGTIGRLFAMLVNDFIKSGGSRTLIDPGAWAQVGSAAFWCGSGRITATIAIITLEITGEYSYLPAIGVAVAFAKWTGDAISHGLYHQMIHLKEMDFLGDMPRGVTKGAKIIDIMTKEIVMFKPTETCEKVRKMLASNGHNGFPVVKVEAGGKVALQGIVLRKYLLARVGPTVDPGDDIEVSMYMDPSPHIAYENMVAYQSLQMFTVLGLRHLPVVNDNHSVVGFLTRANFHKLEHWQAHHNAVERSPSAMVLTANTSC